MMSTEKNLKKIIELMRQDDSVDAPADSIRWAHNLFRTRSAEPKSSLLRRVAAVLQMDIAPNKAAFGERSASMSEVHQMLFKADENAVDLRIEPADSGFSVQGQILGEGFANAELTLAGDTRDFGIRATDTSEFLFEDVPAGRYELLIRGHDIEISLKSIDIE